MSTPKRGRGRRATAFNQRVHRAMRTTLHDRLIGRELKPPGHPPEFVQTPWNSATIALGGTGDTDFTFEKIYVVLAAQLGLYTGTTAAPVKINATIRIKSVRVWALKRDRPVSLKCYNFGSSDVLKSFSNWPAYNQFARVGYEWPESQQILPFEFSNTSKAFAIETGASEVYIAYLQVLWRGYDPKITLQSRIAHLTGDLRSFEL